MSEAANDDVERVVREQAPRVTYRYLTMQELHEAEMRLRHDIYASPLSLRPVKLNSKPVEDMACVRRAEPSFATRLLNWILRK